MSSLIVSAVQTEIYWEDKTANLQMLEEKIMNIREKTEIVVLPEMFSTGFSMKAKKYAESMDGESMEWMKNLSAKKNVILTGSLIIEEEGHYYNRMIWMLPNGQLGIYDKRHLFTYAGENKYYSPGSKRLICSVKGWKVNLQVCYDLRFPVWARQHPDPDRQNPEFDVLIYTANWPVSRILAWKTLLKARAIENQCYVVGVNRVGKDGNDIRYPGDSMIIDPLGDILHEGENREQIFTVMLDHDHLLKVREKYPFWKDGDQFDIR